MQALYACSSSTNFIAQRSFLRITSRMRLICQQFSVQVVQTLLHKDPFYVLPAVCD